MIAAVCIQAMAQTDVNEARIRDFYVSHVLDSLEGRDWLLTEGFLTDAFLAKAKERGMALTIVPMMMRDNEADAAWLSEVEAMNRDALTVAASLSPLVFARLWISDCPEEAVRRLALLVMPDVWTAEGRAAIPNQLVFLGGSEADAQKDVEKRFRDHEEFWDEVGEALMMTDGKETQAETAALKQRLRRQTSWVANNLGVALLRAGKTNEAFTAFTRAAILDTSNVSAMLNKVVLIKNGVRPELTQQASLELDALMATPPHPGLLWGLTQNCGEVAEPDSFVQFGWYWGLSGIPSIQGERWIALLERVPEADRKGVAGMLMAAQMGQTGGSDMLLSLVRMWKDPDGPFVGMPPKAFAPYIQGSLLLQQKQYAAAEALLKRSLEAGESYSALNDYAMVMVETRRFADAEAWARKAIALKADDSSAYDTLGLALEGQDKLDDALAAFTKALELATEEGNKDSLNEVQKNRDRLREKISATE